MAIHLPRGLKLPPNLHEVNASLLMTKYADVKNDKEESKRIVDRVCRGKTVETKFRFTEISNTQFIVMKLMDRMIVDQSGGVMENSNLSLHPHFGNPVIPGSAVKGAARHYLWELWNEAEGAEKETLQAELDEIFGDSASAGKVSFLMAIPYGSAGIEPDVLTCHHGDYYSTKKKKDRATDDESPNPQFFPVVKKGASFEFVVRPTARGTDALAEKALGYLKSALEINGIGAKTAAGYGWFEEDLDAKEKREKEEHESSLGNAVSEFLKDNNPLREDLLNEGEFSSVVGRVLETGTDDEKMVLVALLKSEKMNYLKKQKQLAGKGKAGPKERVQKIGLLLADLEGMFE